MILYRVFKKILAIGLVISSLLISTIAMPVAAETPVKAKVLIVFNQQPGAAEQALVRGLGGDIKYTYHLVPAIAALAHFPSLPVYAPLHHHYKWSMICTQESQEA